jgi:hypothetical protein
MPRDLTPADLPEDAARQTLPDIGDYTRQSARGAILSATWPHPDLRAQIDPRWGVHAQHAHGRPPGRRQPDDQRVVDGKMLVPRLASRIEEGDDRGRHGIDPREVRTFVQIAVVARQSQVCRGRPRPRAVER